MDEIRTSAMNHCLSACGSWHRGEDLRFPRDSRDMRLAHHVRETLVDSVYCVLKPAGNQFEPVRNLRTAQVTLLGTPATLDTHQLAVFRRPELVFTEHLQPNATAAESAGIVRSHLHAGI